MVTEARLVLWDIDLTLVDLRGLGGHWYRRALAEVTGVTLTAMPSFQGRTERAITTELLTAHEFEVTDELIERIWAELIRQSEQTYPTLSKFGRALPGAEAALSVLANRGVMQSLVTGNLPEIAHHKLSAFGLHEFVDFEIGGYGTLSLHRPDLVSRAVELATAKHGLAFAPESVVVIGDTPDDVAAALAHGAVAVGVATGGYPAAELAAAGADVVLNDLSDTEAVVSVLTGSSPQ